jgi:predicted phosphodiesterase
MRYGVLADIHANLPALNAAVDELRRLGAERWIVAGDVVGYGPHPNECVDAVASLDAAVVAGNHDLIVLGRLPDTRCIELARASLRWTRGVLSADARAFLETLPATVVADGGVLVAHGSITDPQQYVTTEAQALAQLEQRRDARIVILGHTHRPLAVAAPTGRLRAAGAVQLPRGRPVLLNPGAVGQARELRARARAMLLDLDAERATFVRLPYDIRRSRTALRAAGLSARGCHLRPGPGRAVRRLASAAERRLPGHAARGSR